MTKRTPVPLNEGMKEPLKLQDIQALILKMTILDGVGKSLKEKDGLKIIVHHDEIEKEDRSGIVWKEKDTLFYHAQKQDTSVKVDSNVLDAFAEVISPIPNLVEKDENFGVSKIIVKSKNYELRLKAIQYSNERA